MTEETRALLPPMRFRHRTLFWIAALLLGGGRATAQVVYQLDGAVDLGYTAQTTSVATTDPSDTQTETSGRLFTNVRPGVSIAFGSPRLLWHAGYIFAGSFSLDGKASNTYSNQANLSLGAQLSSRTIMTLTAGVTQGSTFFQLSQRAPDAGEPAVRAPGDPALVSASLAEFLVYEISPHFRFGQGLSGTLSAPQDDLGLFNSTLTGSLYLDRVFPSDAIGVEVRSAVSRLQPLLAGEDAYFNLTNSVLGRWNHDFDYRWNALLTAGVQQVVTFAGSYPLAIVPTASLTARYLAGNALGSIELTHGATTNVQTGTVSLTQQISARGFMSLDPIMPRVLGASVGFLHNEPLGESSALVAAGTGNAFQADVGLTWGLTDGILATARYTVAYQFGQDGGIPPVVTHVVLIGVTARYSNSRFAPPSPRMGQRVDGSDGVMFPETNVEKR